MKNIFIGYLFIFLNFNLNLDGHIVALIPDFLGYYFMVRGLNDVSEESFVFDKVCTFAVGMGFYTAILFILDLVGLSANLSLGLVSWAAGMVSLAVSLYISHTIIVGIKDIERIRNISLASGKLESAWTGMAIMQVLAMVTITTALGLVCIIVSLILTIVYLVAFYRTKNLYEAARKKEDYFEERGF